MLCEAGLPDHVDTSSSERRSLLPPNSVRCLANPCKCLHSDFSCGSAMISWMLKFVILDASFLANWQEIGIVKNLDSIRAPCRLDELAQDLWNDNTVVWDILVRQRPMKSLLSFGTPNECRQESTSNDLPSRPTGSIKSTSSPAPTRPDSRSVAIPWTSMNSRGVEAGSGQTQTPN